MSVFKDSMLDMQGLVTNAEEAYQFLQSVHGDELFPLHDMDGCGAWEVDIESRPDRPADIYYGLAEILEAYATSSTCKDLSNLILQMYWGSSIKFNMELTIIDINQLGEFQFINLKETMPERFPTWSEYTRNHTELDFFIVKPEEQLIRIRIELDPKLNPGSSATT